MKLLIVAAFMLSVLSACNFQESLKEVGDGIQDGVQNAGEALKDAPADVSEASNEAEADIKKQSLKKQRTNADIYTTYRNRRTVRSTER